MNANDPFVRLPEAASFTVTSTTVADGAAWSPEQLSSGVPGAKDVSGLEQPPNVWSRRVGIPHRRVGTALE